MTDKQPETKIIVDNFMDLMEDKSTMTYKQVAAKHNIPVGTVKRRINRGKAKLKAEGFA